MRMRNRLLSGRSKNQIRRKEMKKALAVTIVVLGILVLAVSMGITVDAQGERSISMIQSGNTLIFEKSSDEPAGFLVFWGVNNVGEVEGSLEGRWDGNIAVLQIPEGAVSIHFYPYGWKLNTDLIPTGSDWYWLLPVTSVTVTPTSSPTSTSTPTAIPTVDTPTATLVPTLEPTVLPTGTPEPTATSTPVPSVSMEGDQGKIVFIANTEILEPLVIRWGIPGTPAEYLVWDGNVARITPPEGATTLWFSPGELDLTTEFEPIEQNWFFIPEKPEKLTFLPFLTR
jgi:hypothetical protein